MKRRTFTTSALAALAVPMTTRAQTPTASPESAITSPTIADFTTADLAATLASISPVELLRALVETPVTVEELRDPTNEVATNVIPWMDNGDRDLFSALGGVGITLGDFDPYNLAAHFLGAFIVFESAEIAYQELIRRIGDSYEEGATSGVKGSTYWIVDSDTEDVYVGRISNVLIYGYSGPAENPVNNIPGLVDHLAMVAGRVSA